MAGYSGTKTQQALQRVVFETHAQIGDFPALVNGGRYLMVEDPDRLGWPALQARLSDNALVPFRFISPAQHKTYVTGLEERGHRVERSVVVRTDPALEKARIVPPLAHGLAPGFTLEPPLLDPTERAMVKVQSFLAWHGIARFVAPFLMDGTKRASVLLRDPTGDIAAFAYAHKPHNRFSLLRDHGWLGLIAVAPDFRGRGLGVLT